MLCLHNAFCDFLRRQGEALERESFALEWALRILIVHSKKRKETNKMTLYDELVARGLIAQVTDEEEIKDLINNGKATFYIGNHV